MWTPEGSEGFAIRNPASAFDEENLGGADECIPTISPCLWRGKNLPDHGEAWSLSWSLNEAALAQHVIATDVYLPISGLSMRRSVSLHGGEVLLDYELENRSEREVEYIWAFHPDFSIVEGDRIEMPSDCAWFQTEVALGCPLGPRGAKWRWPDPIPGISLDRLDFEQYNPAAIKLFTQPLSIGYAAIRNDRTGDMLALHFDPSLHDTVGIWLTQGGWRGHHHLALEPTNGAPDALDVAVTDWKRFATIMPREVRRWQIRMVLSASSASTAESPSQ